MKILLAVSTALLAVATGASGSELTAVQKRGWADYTDGIEKMAAKMGEVCGTTFAAAYDTASYPNFDPNTDMTRGTCEKGISTLRDACRDDIGKEAASAIKTLTCRYSTTDTGVTRNGDELIFRINPDNRGEVKLQSGSVSTWENAVIELL